MSKQKGALRYTDKATGRPVIDIPKDMLAAHLGKPISRTARRAQGKAMSNGKGDTRRPENKTKFDLGWDRTFGPPVEECPS